MIPGQIMGVASHLGIRLDEYDARIRTFIPDYEAMLEAGAAAVPAAARTIVDLGTGTGAFSATCLTRARRARVIGIDADAAMLEAARRRLGRRASFLTGAFEKTPVPHADAIISSFALHHVRTETAKLALYRRLRRSLRRGGRFVVVDCQPAQHADLRRDQFDAWRAHLRTNYSARAAAKLLEDWSHEDVYVPLEREQRLLDRAGFDVELIWRRGAFAVLASR
jgi:ubiquinone/menaquinone biosynthesis C-methylase UbiE